MKDSLTYHEFAVINRRRCEAKNGFNHKLSDWSLSDWFAAVLGELGEAANVAKKLNRVRDGIPGNKETPDELRQMLKDEIADTAIGDPALIAVCGADTDRTCNDGRTRCLVHVRHFNLCH